MAALDSIAASFAFAGITPDWQDGGALAVRHGVSELPCVWWCRASRRSSSPPCSPICAYNLGRAVSGRDTAWALLVAAALASPFVSFGSQARYYSATPALTALCGWAIGVTSSTPDGVMQGGPDSPGVLLFHTHSLSFLILSALLVACAPLMLRSKRDPSSSP